MCACLLGCDILASVRAVCPPARDRLSVPIVYDIIATLTRGVLPYVARIAERLWSLESHRELQVRIQVGVWA